MNCPYCGKELQKGVLISSHSIKFYPDEGGLKDRILLKPQSGYLGAIFSGYTVESFYCGGCGMIITPAGKE